MLIMCPNMRNLELFWKVILHNRKTENIFISNLQRSFLKGYSTECTHEVRPLGIQVYISHGGTFLDCTKF